MKVNKIISLVLLVVVILNMILFAFGKISNTGFWSVIVVTAVYAYFVMPRLKHKE